MKQSKTIKVYYVGGIIDDSENNICYRLYDEFSHDEITAEELFAKVVELSDLSVFDCEPYPTEIDRSSVIYEDEDIYLTFDKYEYAFDIWRK